MFFFDSPVKKLKFGLPSRGLVSLIVPGWDVRGRNILPVGADDFSNNAIWADTDSAVCTVTAGQTDPFGGSGAYRIQSAGGTTVVKKRIIGGSTGIAGQIASTAIWIKVNAGKCMVRQTSLASGNDSALLTSASYQKIIISGAEFAGYLRSIRLLVEASGDALDVTVYQPQINFTTLAPYSDPLGLPQTLSDYSSRGNSLIRGATTSVGADDPTLSASGAIHATDDIGISATVSGLSMLNFSRLIVGKFNGTAGAITALADPTSTTKYQAIKQQASGKLSVISRNADAETESASQIDVSTSLTSCLILTAKDGTLTLDNMSAGTSLTLADTAPTTACRVGTGCVPASTVAQIITAMTWNVAGTATRAWSASEKRQAYKGAKAICAGIGVTCV